jgi:hypothetical protein
MFVARLTSAVHWSGDFDRDIHISFVIDLKPLELTCLFLAKWHLKERKTKQFENSSNEINGMR